MSTVNLQSTSLIRKNFNIKSVKKLIYDTLVGSDDLLDILGGSENIWHVFPLEEEIKHPALFYSIVNQDSFPLDEDDSTSQLVSIVFGIETVDDSPNTSRVDDIDNIVFTLFNGTILKDEQVSFRKAGERIYYSQYFDSEIRVWRTVSRFSTIVSPV